MADIDTTAQGTQEADGAFAHLDELVAELPRMQGLGAALARARAAREVALRAREARTCETMLAQADAAIAAARDKLRACEQGGSEAERLRHVCIACEQERGLRMGPAQNARAALTEALARGGFADAAEAHAAELPDEELAALEARVAAYQRDYAATLVICEQADAAEAR